MHRLLVRMVALSALVFLFAGCSSSSSGPDEDGPGALDIPGLVTFYEFDGDFTDESGNGHDFISRTRMQFVADHNGAAESALYLAGPDAINIPDADDLDFTGAFSVAAWVMADLGSMAYHCLVDKGYADGAWSVGVGGTTTPQREPLYLYVGTHIQSFGLNEAIPVGEDTWVHFVCCFNDTTDQTTFYINGEYAFTQTAGEPVTLGVNDRDLLIGNSHWNDQYVGAVDQLALFNRELTVDEVELLHEHD